MIRMASTSLRLAIAVYVAAALAFPAAGRTQDVSQQEQHWETQYGQQRYAQLMQQGEIVPSQSPLYATLRPVADKIAAVADAQYYAPFHFVILNDRTPNAFAAPGGNVYVTTGMLSFVRNRDELAGVLCHEVNHDIHHDVYAMYQQQLQHQPQGQGGYGVQEQEAGFSRAAESNADRAGAYTCAKAGFNPWGMVWNFRQYRQSAGAAHQSGALSDHPSDEQRVSQLVALFNGDPATFGKFRDDVAMATPIQFSIPAQVAQQAPPGYGYPQGQGPTYPPPSYPPPGYGYPQAPQGYGYPQSPQGYGYPQGQGPTYPPPSYPPPGYGYPQAPQGYGYPQSPQGYGYPQGQGPTYPPPSYPPPGYGYPQSPQGYGYPQGQGPTYPPPSYPPPGYAPPGSP